MDKNQAVGFGLMALLLVVYFYFFAPKPNTTPNETPSQDSGMVAKEKEQAPEAVIQENQNIDTSINTDSMQNSVLNERFGVFAKIAEGEEKEYVLDNDLISITLSSKGAKIKKVQLKKYEDYQYKPLILLDEKSSDLQYRITTRDGEIDITELYFDSVKKTAKGDTTIIEFKSQLAENQYISYTYRLWPDDYQVQQFIVIKGLENQISDDKVQIVWKNDMKRLEMDLEYSRYYTTVNYFQATSGFDDLKARTNDKQEYTFEEPVKWLSFKQKFFSAGLVFNTYPNRGYISSQYLESDTNTVKSCVALIEMPLSSFDENQGPNIFYFGPNRLKTLKKVSEDFSKNLYLGYPVIKWVNKYVIINIFTFLERFIANYGIIIIILVLIIKIVLSPLTYKSHISMAKTRVLKPELDALKEEYKDDTQKIQSEQMKLYQQVGVNPLSGCIPMLLQMPILFAMFQFIPHAIELRHKSFLWASDLSTYDSILNLPFTIPGYGSHVSLFTLLMTLSTILYTWANSQATAATMQGPMKTMQYLMPVVFMFVLNKFPAGLTFYYFVSNILSFAQIAVIRRFVDDDKIRSILDENRKKNKNKKKSAFQQRLDEAMKASKETKKSNAGARQQKKKR